MQKNEKNRVLAHCFFFYLFICCCFFFFVCVYDKFDITAYTQRVYPWNISLNF